MLLPGLLCDEELWRDQVAALQGRWTCRVADLSAGDTLADLARPVLDAAAPTFALAAFSFGGYVAQQILRMAPHRVSRLALIGTDCRTDPPERQAARAATVQAARAPGRFDGITDRLLRSFVHPDRLSDAALTGRIKAMTARMGRNVFIRQSLVPRQDGTAVLQSLRCPVLVLCGAEDLLTPPDGHRRMAALIPDSTLEILPRCGHMAPMERPGAVTQAMQAWLDR